MADVMIDLEALGKRAGVAITELAAVVFNPETGETGATFYRAIRPELPFHCDLETIQWHKDQGTWPRPVGTPEVKAVDAINDFKLWIQAVGDIREIWSWGIDYDFPILEGAFDLTASGALPWKFSRVSCARTIWKMAFPGTRPEKRPHNALEDAKAAVADLMMAVRTLTNRRLL